MTRLRITKNANPISSVEDWRRYAPPKDPYKHWKDDRSAKELAKAWCADEGSPSVPSDVTALFQSHPAFADVRELDLVPEEEIHFDTFRGPRNADLAGIGMDDRGRFAITVEAKADETFDQVVSTVEAKATMTAAENSKSNALTRVNQLMGALFPEGVNTPEHRTHLRYQLLTATAGTLKLAERISADRALLIIHEFVTVATDDDRHESNATDLDYFVQCLSKGEIVGVAPGQIVDPFHIRTSALFASPANLYIGKAMTYKRPSRYPAAHSQ